MTSFRHAVLASCLLAVFAGAAAADQWTELHPTTSPAARAGHTMVTVNGTIYLFGGYQRASALSGGLWGNPFRSIGPLASFAAANGPVNDFWKFDGRTWLKIADNAPPAVRYLHSAVAYNNKMYVFGGISTAGTYLNDMWSYSADTNTWREETQGGIVKPSARANHSAAVDDGSMIVYGGKASATSQSDAYAWVFNFAAQTWTRKSANPSGGLDCHDAVMTGGKMYVFGGNSGSTKSNTTYAYDPTQDTWTREVTQGTTPDARAFFAMTTEGTTFTIFGGESNSVAAFNDAWEFDTTTRTWTRRGDMVSAATRSRIAAVTSHGARASSTARPGAAASAVAYYILFGGLDAAGVYSDRTFQYVASTGNACAATYSSSLLLRIPILTYSGAYYWADLQNVGASRFVVRDYGIVTSTSTYSGCTPATLSADWQLHVPAIDYDGVSYRADFQYDGAAFVLTAVTSNATAATTGPGTRP